MFKDELNLYLVKRSILKEKNLVFDQIDKQHIRCFNGIGEELKKSGFLKIYCNILDNEEVEVKI